MAWWDDNWYADNWWADNWWAGAGATAGAGSGGDDGLLVLCRMLAKRRRRLPEVCLPLARKPRRPPIQVLLLGDD